MQKAVEIESRNLTLRGMLHIPDNASGKVPVVCIFHWFTGTKVEPHFIFVKLSRRLEKAGIASLRFDFGGSGESDGDFEDMTILTELEDAKAILDYAKSLPFADAERIGVVGLSMGGTVASLLAGDRKEDVAALCLWAPAGDMGERLTQDRRPEEIQAFRSKGWWDVGGLTLGIDFLDTALDLDTYKRAASMTKGSCCCMAIRIRLFRTRFQSDIWRSMETMLIFIPSRTRIILSTGRIGKKRFWTTPLVFLQENCWEVHKRGSASFLAYGERRRA